MVLLRTLPGTMSNTLQKSKCINRVNFIKLLRMSTKIQHQDCLIRSCLETSAPWNYVSTSRSHMTLPNCNYQLLERHPIHWLWNSDISWAFPPRFSKQCLTSETISVTLQTEFDHMGCTGAAPGETQHPPGSDPPPPINNYICTSSLSCACGGTSCVQKQRKG